MARVGRKGGAVKPMSDLRKAPVKIPKPRIPKSLGPVGGGTGEANPPVTPSNSQMGVKQRAGVKNPMSAL